MSVNTVSARLIYNNAKKSVRTAGIDVNRAKLTQSFLRLEQAIVANRAQYVFPILSNQAAAAFNTENRLLLNDSFVLSQLGLFLAAPASAVDAAFDLKTRPSADEFSTALSAEAAKIIYNGFISLSINNQMVIPSWDTLRHLKIPQTQFTAAVNSPADQNDFSSDGFYPVEPNITIVGSKNTVLTLNLPAAVSTIHPNSRIVLILRGVLAQNSTSVS